MEIDWDDIATRAQQDTDETFTCKISDLTSFKDEDITDLINQSGISKVDLVNVLKTVHDATTSNNDKATAISNINDGVNLLVAIAGKIL